MADLFTTYTKLLDRCRRFASDRYQKLLNGYQLLTQLYPKIPHFITLARLDKPIGIYLLLWPTMWGLWFAAEGFPGWHLFLVFTLGTVLTRSAGCIVNDIADRDLDISVKRTASRPLAQGYLSVPEAIIFAAILMFLSLILVLTTNLLTLVLAFIATIIAAIYPWMKRFTYLPQVVLGVAFSFGIPMAFAAIRNEIPNLAWLLTIANVIWTVGYDTEYAMVDRDDDLKIGTKSTAILFADMDKLMIGILQFTFIGSMYIVERQIGLSWPYYIGLAVASGLLIYQQFLIADRDRANCFEAFLNNHWVGLTIFIGIFVHFLLTPIAG